MDFQNTSSNEHIQPSPKHDGSYLVILIVIVLLIAAGAYVWLNVDFGINAISKPTESLEYSETNLGELRADLDAVGESLDYVSREIVESEALLPRE